MKTHGTPVPPSFRQKVLSRCPAVPEQHLSHWPASTYVWGHYTGNKCPPLSHRPIAGNYKATPGKCKAGRQPTPGGAPLPAASGTTAAPGWRPIGGRSAAEKRCLFVGQTPAATPVRHRLTENTP